MGRLQEGRSGVWGPPGGRGLCATAGSWFCHTDSRHYGGLPDPACPAPRLRGGRLGRERSAAAAMLGPRQGQPAPTERAGLGAATAGRGLPLRERPGAMHPLRGQQSQPHLRGRDPRLGPPLHHRHRELHRSPSESSVLWYKWPKS